MRGGCLGLEASLRRGSRIGAGRAGRDAVVRLTTSCPSAESPPRSGEAAVRRRGGRLGPAAGRLALPPARAAAGSATPFPLLARREALGSRRR